MNDPLYHPEHGLIVDYKTVDMRPKYGVYVEFSFGLGLTYLYPESAFIPPPHRAPMSVRPKPSINYKTTETWDFKS